MAKRTSNANLTVVAGGSPRKKRGRKPKSIQPAQLEELAELCLHNYEIADLIGFSRSYFCELLQHKPELSEALARGRAKSLAACATTVLDAAKRKKDPKMALEFLRRHSRAWSDKVPSESQLAGSTDTNAAAEKLGPETCVRMARTYLQLQGFQVTELE